MNNTVKSLLIFTAGAAIGSVVTWQFVKKKYEQIAQEEIDSVKETFSKRQKTEEKTEEINNNVPVFDDDDIEEAIDIIEDLGYTPRGESKISKPTVISPHEFGEIDEYEKISLTYYIDGSLADDNDELIEDVDGTIGFESLNHFGEYEDDSVFVRNDRLKCDYEILLDQRNYSDVVNIYPHKVEE